DPRTSSTARSRRLRTAPALRAPLQWLQWECLLGAWAQRAHFANLSRGTVRDTESLDRVRHPVCGRPYIPGLLARPRGRGWDASVVSDLSPGAPLLTSCAGRPDGGARHRTERACRRARCTISRRFSRSYRRLAGRRSV